MSNFNYPAEEKFEKDRKRRAQRKSNKATQRSQPARATRRKDWDALMDEDFYDPAVVDFEPVMPRTGQAPPQPEKQMQVEAEDNAETQGLVIEVSSGLCRVEIDGNSLLCTLRGALKAEASDYSNIVAAGDRVEISSNGSDAGVVERVLPRQSELTRTNPSNVHKRQVIAANVDQILIVASWREPHLWPELIDRYMITAQHADITPVICVNKIDLAEDRAEVQQVLQPYRELGYQILITSAASGEGLELLRDALKSKISVLAGLSGVGKSTLLSAAQPGFELRTGAVSTYNQQGQHTTTQALMLPFGEDGYVIDTPGIREFGLIGLQQQDIAICYPEFASVGDCRFVDCTHLNEPDCAVMAAVEEGQISAMRYKNYRKLTTNISV